MFSTILCHEISNMSHTSDVYCKGGKITNLCLLRSNTVHCKASFHIIDQPKVLTSAVDCDHIYSKKLNIITRHRTSAL